MTEKKKWDSFCGLLFDTVEQRNEHEKNCNYCRQYYSMDEDYSMDEEID